MLPHPNPHLNPLLRRSRLHRSVSFRHRVVLARVAKHLLRPLLLLLRLRLLRLQPRHLLPRRHRQHQQSESRPRLRHALRCLSVLRPRRRVSRFRLLPAVVPRFLLRASPSRRPPACVAKHLLLVRVLVVVPVVPVPVVPVPVVLALAVVLVAALLVVVPVAEALTALVPVVVLAAAVPAAALVVPVAAVPAVAALVVVPVAAVVLVVALVVVPVVRVPSARVVVVVTATNFSRSTHRATRLVKRQSRLVKLS